MILQKNMQLFNSDFLILCIVYDQSSAVVTKSDHKASLQCSLCLPKKVLKHATMIV